MRIWQLPGSLVPLALLGSLLAATAALAAEKTSDRPMRVYFGTYTGAKSKGIYVSQFDPATGKLTAPELAAETKSPSFLAVHPNRRFLYAVGEMSSIGAKNVCDA